MEEKEKRKKNGGRKKGTPNKATAITREVINDIAAGMVDKIREDLLKLSPRDRVNAFLKLCEFNLPKPQSVSLDMSVESKKTIEDRLAELAGEE